MRLRAVAAHILAEVEDGLLPHGPAYLLVDDLVARIPVGMVAAHTLVALEDIRRVDGPSDLRAGGLVVRIPVEVVDSLLTSDVVCPQISRRDLLHELRQSPDTEQ